MASRTVGLVLYVAGGLLFILAGIAWYLGVTIQASIGIIVIVAGLVIVVAGVAGLKAPPSAVAVFVLGLILLGVALSGVGLAPSKRIGPFEVGRDQFTATALVVEATSSIGSVDLEFVDDSLLFYRVTFTTDGFPFQQAGQPDPELTNTTEGDIFILKAKASSERIHIQLGHVPTHNITVTTSMGSIDVNVPASADVRHMSLKTTVGSIDGQLEASQLDSLDAHATTGSINLALVVNGLSDSATMTLRTTTGSVNIELNLADTFGSKVEATTSLGSTNIQVTGLDIISSEGGRKTAQTDNYASSPHRLDMNVSTSLGSINISGSA